MKKEENKIKKYIKNLTIRPFISVIIFLLLAISIKSNNKTKHISRKYIVYNNKKLL